MRTYEQIEADARPGSPFSNGTSGELWMDGPKGCYSCRNDSMGVGDKPEEKHCPILTAALMGVTPKEWTDDGLQDYTCSEYDRRPDDDDDGDDPEPEPGPTPEVAGQVDMFEVFADQVVDALPAPEVARG